MILIYIISSLVYLNGDTLVFVRSDTTIDTWVLGERIFNEKQRRIVNTKAKVSQDSVYALYYEEDFFPDTDSLSTRLSLYDADENRLWQEAATGDRQISFFLTNIFDTLIVLGTTNKYNKEPCLTLVTDRTHQSILQEGDWTSIVDYCLSSNHKYMVIHTRKPNQGRIWDYIYFVDFENNSHWEHSFSTCLSCKRSRLQLRVDNNGQAEIIHKKEHRIFSRDGKLIDIFISN